MYLLPCEKHVVHLTLLQPQSGTFETHMLSIILKHICKHIRTRWSHATTRPFRVLLTVVFQWLLDFIYTCKLQRFSTFGIHCVFGKARVCSRCQRPGLFEIVTCYIPIVSKLRDSQRFTVRDSAFILLFPLYLNVVRTESCYIVPISHTMCCASRLIQPTFMGWQFSMSLIQ